VVHPQTQPAKSKALKQAMILVRVVQFVANFLQMSPRSILAFLVSARFDSPAVLVEPHRAASPEEALAACNLAANMVEFWAVRAFFAGDAPKLAGFLVQFRLCRAARPPVAVLFKPPGPLGLQPPSSSCSKGGCIWIRHPFAGGVAPCMTPPKSVTSSTPVSIWIRLSVTGGACMPGRSSMDAEQIRS
jgi:hypothetical protein